MHPLWHVQLWKLRCHCKAHYRQSYFNALDLSINAIQERFDQPDFHTYRHLEELLMQAVRGEDTKETLALVCDFLWWKFRSLSASAASGHSESHIFWGPKVTYLVCSWCQEVHSEYISGWALINQWSCHPPAANSDSTIKWTNLQCHETPKDLPKGNHESGTPQPSAASTCPQRRQAFLHWCG